MEVKKSPKASLENKRLLFTEIGFVLALLGVLFAFNYSSKEKQVATLEAETAVVEVEDMIPITQETPPPPDRRRRGYSFPARRGETFIQRWRRQRVLKMGEL